VAREIPHPPSRSPDAPFLSFQRVSRWYGQVIGLNDVSCDVGPGLTALLGPNGAGKSTFIKLATGQIRPTTGRALVLGESPFANARVLSRLGYCPEIDNFYEDMTGREFVTQLASMSGFAGAELKRRVESSIERVGMTDRCDRKLGGYSKGMRQRIKVAQAILHDPQVLVLDEPLNGLDPVGRRDMTDLMSALAREGRCVLVSSHILYEVEQLTDSILLMQRGRLLARGSVRDIRDLMDRDTHTPRHIVLRGVDHPRPLAADLLTVPSVTGVRFFPEDPGRLEVETRDPRAFFGALAEVVLAGDYAVESMESPDDHLESILRNLLARK
jgi:ABC-type multidrug transport system, ATPase component